MKKIEIPSVKDFSDLIKFFTDHKELLKTAALPLVIGVAVLFFWFYGAEEDIVVDGMSDYAGNSETTEYNDNPGAKMYVDISGAVVNPGVYEVDSQTRLFQVIEMAGGLTENADVDSLNRAEIVYDGQKIIVGTLGEPSAAASESSDSQSTQSGITNGKVNLNLAGSATLQTIPGIGPSKADRIIDYRNTNGRFRKIEDIMNITGIGEKTFESIKDYITV
ncbi:MAG: helix-hairpin-helix domain-containing protein [Firmicutes bacterium]|nr:helix-hairpin-helix domain-containing protein [Bacillota bacterium]